jgi:hypothetical protein
MCKNHPGIKVLKGITGWLCMDKKRCESGEEEGN